jgi:hypothetical protein
MAAKAAGLLHYLVVFVFSVHLFILLIKGEDTCCAVLVFFFPVGMCCVRQNAREKRGIEVYILDIIFIKNYIILI